MQFSIFSRLQFIFISQNYFTDHLNQLSGAPCHSHLFLRYAKPTFVVSVVYESSSYNLKLSISHSFSLSYSLTLKHQIYGIKNPLRYEIR